MMPLRWKIWLSLPPVGFVVGMIAMSSMGRDFKDVPRSLELPEMAAITFGLLAASVLYGRAVGRARACPMCKTTWGELVQVGETETSVEQGPQHGRFTVDGWENGSLVRASSTFDLTCRTCQHRFRKEELTKHRS